MNYINNQLVNGFPGDLVLVGDGEPMLRLEKRMHCAATGLGLELKFAVTRDHENFGLTHGDTPAVLLGGKVIFSGLPRTETLEGWLRTFIAGQLVDTDGKVSPGHSQNDPAGDIAA